MLKREKRLLNPRLGLNSQALHVEGEGLWKESFTQTPAGSTWGLVSPQIPGPPRPQQGWGGAGGFA